MKLIKIFITTFLISLVTAHGQSLSVFDVDASNFPTMRAKFYAFDAVGNQIRNLSETDFKVTENGTARTVKNVSCPNSIPVAVSSVLVFDMSGSMSGGPPRIESARKAANAWVDGLPLGQSECALVSFDHRSMILHDFTKDRTKLKNSIALLNPAGGTDYNQALIDKPSGGLNIAKTGKNKRVLIFLTDGQPNAEPRTQDIIAMAKQHNITIYAVTLDMPAPQCIKDMTKETGGQYFENITTLKEAERTYQKLLQLATSVEPCEITWQSGVSCTAGNTNVKFEIRNIGLTETTSYQSPNTTIAKLEFNPTYIKFQNPKVGIKAVQKLTVTAINSDYIVNNISTEVPKGFDINPKSFNLKSGESIELIVSYFPIDSGYHFCRFDLESQPCAEQYYVNGGWRGVKPKTSTLKVTRPNGGESFAVGSDTVITWEGIAEDDLVKIEYSIDNGATWEYIDTARELSYKWNRIPKPTSNQCIVKVSQLDELLDLNSGNHIPEIIWSKTYGGIDYDEPTSILEASDGNLVIAGWSESANTNGMLNKGEADYWIIKLDAINGDTIWTKSYGGIRNDLANSIVESSDGSYVVAGHSGAKSGDVLWNKGQEDYWILKLDAATGDTLWTKTYGGSYFDKATSIINTSDGNLAVAGYSGSSNYDVHLNKGEADYWILKLNAATGDTLWTKSYGGSKDDKATSIIETSDGNFVVAGYSESNNDDVLTNKGEADYWILKLDSGNGDIIWTKTYGGSNADKASSIIETNDGNLAVTGFSSSMDGDLQNIIKSGQCWILKLDAATGDTLWTKTYGGIHTDANSIVAASDGNMIVAGYTIASFGDVLEMKADYSILKIDSENGNVLWTKAYGGSGYDKANSIIETSDRSIVLAGYSQSQNFDVPANRGWSDYWILKIAERIELQSAVSDSLFAIVAPELNPKEIDMKQCLVASVKDSLVTDFIINSGTYKCRIDSIYFTGTDKDAFSLVSGLPIYTVEAGKNKATEFRFRPNRVGLYNAEIVIITQADTLRQTIKGEGVQPTIATVNNLIEFGIIEVGGFRDSLAYTIKNIGTTDIKIERIDNDGPNTTDFKIEDVLSFPITLAPDEELPSLNLKFATNSIGRTNTKLLFNYEGQIKPAEVILWGQAVGGIVQIDDESAFAGERKKIKLRLMNDKTPVQNVAALPFKAKIKYNPTLLTVTDNRGNRSVDKGFEVCEVRGNWDMQNNILGEFDYIAALGDASNTYIFLEDFKWLDDAGNAINAEVEKIDGSFSLLGICHEGGTRLVNPNANIGIQNIAPIPGKDQFTVTAKVTEADTKIRLIALNGKIITEIDCPMNKDKAQDFIIDLSGIATGIYFIEFKSATFSQMEKVMVGE